LAKVALNVTGVAIPALKSFAINPSFDSISLVLRLAENSPMLELTLRLEFTAGFIISQATTMLDSLAASIVWR
jgi:hypothetical protein